MQVNLKPEGCEEKVVPQGVIYLGPSDKNQSTGFLKLKPGQKLAKHNRPVEEKLKQISGSSVIELYDGKRILAEKVLKEGNELLIPANQYHIHKNPTNQECLTYWQFDGNITEIIRNIRKSGK